MGVFTIYCCGTNFNRQRLDELTANLANRTEGKEEQDWLVLDGPGSGQFTPDGKTGRAPKDARPILPDERALAAKARTPGRPRGDINPVEVTRAKGILTGHGWEQNVAHALAVLERRVNTPLEPLRTLNLLGWSRGAITCHMIANALSAHPEQKLQNLIVNVFALDPVAGPGNSGADKSSIPQSVNEYAAVLMEDESRIIMKPTLVAAHGAGGSRHLTYVMPGSHSTGVMVHQGPVGEIVQHLAHDFLLRNGTQLRSPIRLAPQKLCELYAIVRLGLPDLRAKVSVFGKRSAVQAQNPHRDKLFVNPHHEKMFKAAYPTIADFRASPGPAAYKSQIARLAGTFPATHKWLTEVCGLG